MYFGHLGNTLLNSFVEISATRYFCFPYFLIVIMNKIFKNIWNHVRGQVVCVSENASSHDSSAGCDVTADSSAVNAGAPTRSVSYIRSRIAFAVMSAIMGVHPVMAAIDDNAWLTEEGVKQKEVIREVYSAGANYGNINDFQYGNQYWGWGVQKEAITVKANGKLVLGVFGHNKEGSLVGKLGEHGKTRHWAMINHGSIVDSNETVNGQKPVGSTNWIHKFSNYATLDVFDLRSFEVKNASDNFNVHALHLGAGGELENAAGTMNIDELKVGIAADTAFWKSNDVVIEDNELVLPEVEFDNVPNTIVSNNGVMNINNAEIYANVTNNEAASLNVSGNIYISKDLNNQGSITSKNADIESLNNKEWGIVDVENELTVSHLVNNNQINATTLRTRDKDNDGNDATIINNGIIAVQSADLNANVTNAVEMNVAGHLVSNKSFENKGTLTSASGKFGTLINADEDVSSYNYLPKVTIEGLLEVQQLTNSGTLSVGELVAGDVKIQEKPNIYFVLELDVDRDLTANTFYSDLRGVTTAAHFNILNKLENHGEVTQTSTDGSSNMGITNNYGKINLKHDTHFSMIQNFKGSITGNVNISADSINFIQGNLGAEVDRVKSIHVTDFLKNYAGKIYVENAKIDGKLFNEYILDVDGVLEFGTDGNDDCVYDCSRNEDKISASKYIHVGVFENGGTLTQKDSGKGESTFGVVRNYYDDVQQMKVGSMIFSDNVTMYSLDNSWKGRVEGRIDLKIQENLNNTGNIGKVDERLTFLKVDGSVVNAGDVYADRIEFGGEVQNTGAIYADTLHIVSNATNKNGTINVNQIIGDTLNGTNSTITAETVDLTNLDITGGSVNLTGNIASTVDNLRNSSGNLTLAGGLNVVNLYNGDEYRNADSIISTNGIISVTGEFKNFGQINSANGKLTLNVNTLVNNADAILTSNNLVLNGGSNSGQLAVHNKLTVANGIFEQLDGTLDLSAQTASLYLENGTIKLAQEGATQTINELRSTGISSLENSTQLTINKVVETDGVSYSQTKGSLTINEGFFSNSTIDITGGEFDRSKSGDKTFGIGNKISLSGENKTLPSNPNQPLDKNWRNGFTYAHVGVLDSRSSVTVYSGAILEADAINLTAQSLTLDGGILASSLSSFFESVTEDFYTIDSGDATKLPTSILITKDVGDFNQSFKDNLKIDEGGGTLVLTDDQIYLTAVASANTKFGEAFGGTNTHVVFTGEIADETIQDNNFYLDTFNKLKEEQSIDSVFYEPGIIFSNMAYMNKDTANGTAFDSLVVGNASTSVTDAYLLDQSIGFRNVLGASEITVRDGKTFVLTGNSEGIDLVSKDGVSGSVVVQGNDSLFQLGTLGPKTANKGQLASLEVTDNAAFKVINGAYDVDQLTLTSGTGEVAENGIFNLDHYTDNASASITNSGLMNFLQANEINGKITTKANAKVVAEHGLTLSNSGSLITDGRLVSYGINTLNGNLKVPSF